MLSCSRAAVLLTCCWPRPHMLSCSHAAVLFTCRCPVHMPLSCSHATVMLTCYCTAPAPVLLINGCLRLEPATFMWCSLAHAAVLHTSCCHAYILWPCFHAAVLHTSCCPTYIRLPCSQAAALLTRSCPVAFGLLSPFPFANDTGELDSPDSSAWVPLGVA